MSDEIAVIGGVAGLICVTAVLVLLFSRERAWTGGGWERLARLSFLFFILSFFAFLACLVAACFNGAMDWQIIAPIIIVGCIPLLIVASVIYRSLPNDTSVKRGRWHLRAAGISLGTGMVGAGALLRMVYDVHGLGPLALVGFGILVAFMSLAVTGRSERMPVV